MVNKLTSISVVTMITFDGSDRELHSQSASQIG